MHLTIIESSQHCFSQANSFVSKSLHRQTTVRHNHQFLCRRYFKKQSLIRRKNVFGQLAIFSCGNRRAGRGTFQYIMRHTLTFEYKEWWNCITCRTTTTYHRHSTAVHDLTSQNSFGPFSAYVDLTVNCSWNAISCTLKIFRGSSMNFW